jgi:hypothetical protein
MDGGMIHFSKMSAQREEEEESRDSRVRGFGVDDVFGPCLFVPFPLFRCCIEYIVLFNRCTLIARLGTTLL